MTTSQASVEEIETTPATEIERDWYALAMNTELAPPPVRRFVNASWDDDDDDDDVDDDVEIEKEDGVELPIGLPIEEPEEEDPFDDFDEDDFDDDFDDDFEEELEEEYDIEPDDDGMLEADDPDEDFLDGGIEGPIDLE